MTFQELLLSTRSKLLKRMVANWLGGDPGGDDEYWIWALVTLERSGALDREDRLLEKS